MAFKLSKAEHDERAKLAGRLRTAHAEMMTQATTVSEAVTNLNDAINDYNAILEDVQSFVEARKDAWQSEHDDKSEKWQEGEKAEAVSTLIGEWEGLDLSEVDQVEAPSAPDVTHADDLEALPAEAEA
jgi:exonuclease V gamma subunit